MVESTTTDSLTIVRPRAEKIFVRDLALLEQPPVQPVQPRRRRREKKPLLVTVARVLWLVGRPRSRT